MCIVAVDSSSASVYVTGYVSGALDGQDYAGMNDMILLKYKSSGEWQWTRLDGSAGNDFGNGGK